MSDAEEAFARCEELRQRLQALSQLCLVFWLPLECFYALGIWIKGEQFAFARELALGLLIWGGGFIVLPACIWGVQLTDLAERSLGGARGPYLAGLLGVAAAGLVVALGLYRVWAGAAGLFEALTAPALAWFSIRTLSAEES